MICPWYTKYIQWMYLVYHWHIIIKRVQNKPVWYRLGISKRYAWGLHIQWIFIVYTMYIHGIYSDVFILKEYTLINSIYNDVYIYIVYVQDIQCITCAYTPPSGWCCGGGQGAERPWVKVSVDLGLCCHRVAFNLAIKLYHDAWLMSVDHQFNVISAAT